MIQYFGMNKKIVQLLALFVLLVVLPAGSWFYLKKGLEYRLEATHELGQFGALPAEPMAGLDGVSVSVNQFSKGVVIVSRVEAAIPAVYNRILEELGKVHTQFDARQDVFFLLAAPARDSAQLLHDIAQYALNDPGQVFLLRSPAKESPDFGFSAAGADPQAAWVALADTSGQIRQYYDFRDGGRVKRLVEHITMLMPVIEREQAILKRDKEK